jgi:hypothetical protein
MRNYYVPGDWNALCDVCGFKHKASQLRKRWDGAMVCSDDFEQRHPQDFLRVSPEQIAVPWARPEPPDVYTSVGSALYTTITEQLITTEAGALLLADS